MRIFVLLMLWVLYVENSYAQKHNTSTSVGIKLGYNLFAELVNGRRGQGEVDKYVVYSSGYYDEGSHIGIFLRKDFKRFLLQTDLIYTSSIGGLGLYNTNVEQMLWNGELINHPDEWRYSGTLYYFRRLELPISLGLKVWKPIKNIGINLELGISPSYLFYYPRHSQFYNKFQDILISVNNSYNRWGIDYFVGGSIDFWRFNFDVRHYESLTPLSRNLDFRGTNYPLLRKSSQWKYSLSYRFILNKKKK